MPYVFFIGGVPNSGKSTIASGLAGVIPNTQFMDGDFVFSDTEMDDINKLLANDRWQKHLEKIVVNVNEIVAHGQNVSVAWPLLQKDFDYVKNNLSDQATLYCIFLNPNLSSLENKCLTRPLTDWDRKRGHEMHAEGYPIQPFLSLVLDTAKMLPFDVVQAILKGVGLGKHER